MDKRITELDAMRYMTSCEDPSDTSPQKMAEALEIDLDHAWEIYDRLLMRGFAMPAYSPTEEGERILEEWVEALAQAGDIFTSDPEQRDYMLCEQAGYLVGKGITDMKIHQVRRFLALATTYKIEKPFLDEEGYE